MSKPLISVKKLNKTLKQENLILLDCSKKDKTKDDVQIQGARYFDLTTTFRDTNNSLPNTLPSPEQFEKECRKLGINKDSKIVVYDNLGIYLSPRVWWLFRVMGHKNISVLDGGLPAWIEEGYDVEYPKKKKYKKGNFKAKFKKKRYSQLSDVFQNIKDEKSLIIDARSAGRFAGTAPEPRKELKSGSIPKSINIPYTNVLEDGKYKSKEELLEIFNALRADDRNLIFSCGSGITACIIMLASELILDNTKSVFDGSWTEWAFHNNLTTTQ